MTRGKWLILALLIVLAALLTLAVKEKHGQIANRPAPILAKESVPTISRRPPVKKTKKAAEVAPEIKEQSVEKSGQHLQIIVQNEKGQPLSDARVRSKIRAEKTQAALTNFNVDLPTDANGVAEILWPLGKIKQLELSVSKTNYSSRKMIWDFETGDTVPLTYTIKLKQGLNIGGLVVDPEGNPIPDAKVSINRFWSSNDDAPKKKGEDAAFSNSKSTTDERGHWSAHDLPLEFINNISVEAKHTNYISAQASLHDPKTEKELREETHKLVLKRGLEVFGRVLDEQEKPIVGAKVWVGRKYYRERQETKTDAQGGFIFRNVNVNDDEQGSGGTLFSVMADGYEPATQTRKVGTNTDEIVFHLKPGVVLAGKVVNKEGEPIQGVRVVLEGDSGNGDRYEGYEFSKTTDIDGKFEWKGAPNQPMPFYIGKMGYQQKRGVSLKPGAESVVTLLKARQVQGQVLNAETGQPVTEFRIALGRKMDDRFYGDSSDTKDFKSADGSFTVNCSEEYNNGIQASAKDFAEQIQILPKATDEQPAQVDFKLKPSPSLEGFVITPNGQPVSGASVALIEEKFGGRSVQFSNGRMRSYGSGSKIAKTDETGHFTISSPPENGTVVASGDEGFASASIAEVRSSGRLTLQLFGRIEGVLLSPKAEGQELLLSSPNGGISFDFTGYKAAADGNGRFTFEKVPSGTLSIVRLVKTTARSWMHSYATPVIVAPGQTTQITLGGVDATLQGHVSFEAEPTETDLAIAATLSTTPLQVPPGLSAEERTAFYKSPEWKEQMKSRKHYAVIVGKDGSLILDSVVPGDYTLTVSAKKSSEESFRERDVARGEMKITVPIGSGPTSPINVGEIILKPVKSNPVPEIWAK